MPLDNPLMAKAIIERNSGTPYAEVLRKYEITPQKFAGAASENGLERLIDDKGVSRMERLVLASLRTDEARRQNLFRMDEKELAREYRRVMRERENGNNAKFMDGVFNNPMNIEDVVYIAMTSDNSHLKSADRKKVISALEDMGSNVKAYLSGIGLGGLLALLGKRVKSNAHLAALEIFDNARMRRTGDKSLFDLSQPNSVPKWAFTTYSYLSIPEHRLEMVYHTLARANPDFGSADREAVVGAINKLPKRLAKYFKKIGIPARMAARPYSILMDFDKAFQEKTHSKASLFDLRQEYHSHLWGDKFKASNGYWKNDKKHAEDALYHMLIEHHPSLPAINNPGRAEVVQRVESLKDGLKGHIEDTLGLSGMMAHSFATLLEAVEGLDNSYRRRSGDTKSLFDLKQANHLHRWDYSKTYLGSPENSPHAVFHIVNEALAINPNSRPDVIGKLKGLPSKTQDYIRYELGMDALNLRGNVTSNVLNLYDHEFQSQTRLPSLFDRSCPSFIQFDNLGRLVR